MLRHYHSADAPVGDAGVPPGSEASPALLAAPEFVLTNQALGKEEKREILASWLSDARAVPDAPAWRELDDGSFVRFDEVLAALKQLDGSSAAHVGRQSGSGSPGRTRYWRPIGRWLGNARN